MRDMTLAYCPACHGKVIKMFQAVGVNFKGSGFYSTDSKKK
jgi:predicted nucleic acid-binding Zn ribbon protein